jgi:hypothetical protein
MPATTLSFREGTPANATGSAGFLCGVESQLEIDSSGTTLRRESTLAKL